MHSLVLCQIFTDSMEWFHFGGCLKLCERRDTLSIAILRSSSSVFIIFVWNFTELRIIAWLNLFYLILRTDWGEISFACCFLWSVNVVKSIVEGLWLDGWSELLWGHDRWNFFWCWLERWFLDISLLEMRKLFRDALRLMLGDSLCFGEFELI